MSVVAIFWYTSTQLILKYFFFQIIDVTALNKLLGSQFTSEMLKCLLKILSESFLSDNIPVTGILKQIIINDEFKILKMFMDTEDRNGKIVCGGANFSVPEN